MSKWYVVNTLPNQEARAATNLRRQGYRPWLLSIKRSRRHARKIDTVVAPLFPGYLFVEMDLEREAWSPINGTFGVRRLLYRGDRPAALPDAFVQGLRGSLDGDGHVSIDEGLRPGSKARMIAGPFVDCLGTVQHLTAKGRVALLLHVLGQEVATVVPRRMLAPAV